ncbi:Imidazoleglycerol-phosphate dehydratase [Macleaya cordata]|uniref:Imidazoleglycerol-phosphate dehydratase n=1 Tax=Macleaya cordata TaxID=56857 RepID=A0A200Q4V1_MACCD|nr:Imidazoleglycerol-phosphate dehydratase [Macleaya cordata]
MELFVPSRLTTCPSSSSLESRVRFRIPSQTHFQLFSSNRIQKLRVMEATQKTTTCASQAGENGSSFTTSIAAEGRVGEVKRVTKETNVQVKINLDGSGITDSSTGIPFLDHMLDQLASHGLFDVHVKASGDIHIDDHHTNEDVALAIGTSLLQALGDRKGINRFGDFTAPLDEALVHVSLDLSGRPHLGYDLCIPTERVGTYDTQLVEHFFQSLVNTSGMTLHIRQLAGKNSHHIIEATFKAFARALRQATEYDPRCQGKVPRSALKESYHVPDIVSLITERSRIVRAAGIWRAITLTLSKK